MGHRSSGRSPVLLQTAFWLATLVGAALLWRQTGLQLPWAYLIAINLGAFTVYAYDKSAATHGWTRISENTLHLFALFGGTPGAFAAQVILHHKNQKRSFQIRFWLIFIVQIVVIALLRGHAW